ncbi:hypothetical protein BLNAU_18193 [Blattamonas nauphoetae]|uniref:Uncharacterized protein n=1 Tax=Blattamonas nauphoetae TaxID=2049346 RepID=A0ABQ9X547_9EUKA|nr:hypothetical protein BLNAU_18193 [Blattamonas nauphoetae]
MLPSHPLSSSRDTPDCANSWPFSIPAPSPPTPLLLVSECSLTTLAVARAETHCFEANTPKPAYAFPRLPCQTLGQKEMVLKVTGQGVLQKLHTHTQFGGSDVCGGCD